MVQLEANRSERKGRFAPFPGQAEGVLEMVSQLSVDDGQRPVIEVAHQDNRMVEILRKQHCFTEHLFTLKQALPARQTEMAIENVQHCVSSDLDVDSQTESRLPSATV